MDLKTAVCVIVKNEADHILEWIFHHINIGFDTILLYDDHSTDSTREKAAQAGTIADVRVMPWPETERERQAASYEAVCRSFEAEFDWIAFFDADEFIVPSAGERLSDLLARHGDSSAIAIPWLMFGSSGHEKATDNLIIADYTQRADYDFPPNRHVKSIVRPSQVTRCINAHIFNVEGDYAMPDGSPVEWKSAGLLVNTPDYTNWRLHHYFTRSKEHWEKRLMRGQLGKTVRTDKEFSTYDRNEIRDESALVFIKEINIMYKELDD